MSPVYNAGGEALDATRTATKFVTPAHLENDAETDHGKLTAGSLQLSCEELRKIDESHRLLLVTDEAVSGLTSCRSHVHAAGFVPFWTPLPQSVPA